MKLKKGLKGGLKEVKEFLSPHHHHHHHQHDHHHDGGGSGDGEERQEPRQRRRKSGPNESRRGPLAPVLDHLERNNSVPIHLHISHTGSLSVARKGSSSSYSCSDFAHDESKTEAEIHQHIIQAEAEAEQAEQPPQPEQQSQQQEQPQQHSSEAAEEPPPQLPQLEPLPAMNVPEPYIVPASPRRSDDGEETLDPFLVDDPEDPLSDLGSPSPAPALSLDPGSSLLDTSPSESVTLSPAPTSEPPLSAEPAPQTPASEQEAPVVHLPQLVMPTMFLPIPNTDPLSTLLTKYISNPERRPQRDLSGEWTKTDFHTLVMTNSWRALARMARDRIVQADPEDLSLLWSLRLSSLARLRLFNQASAEATNLSNALGSISPPSARTHVLDHILPFELDVIYARVKYWAGDSQGYTDALGALLRRCRRRARIARLDADRQMWIERAARVGLIAASQFIEIKDYTAATALLEPLATQQYHQQESKSTNNDLRSALGRVYLQAGQLDQAEAHFAAVAAGADADTDEDEDEDTGTDASTAAAASKTLNAAFMASARGDWDTASRLLRGLVEQDEANYAAVNNLAVALLGQGKLKEGIEVLEAALESSPSTLAMAEPFLFNLSTLYELRSSIAADKKRDLLIEVAKWCGDGLRTTCLKMPT
ncbi:hypothetical protein BGY98DRAFT_909570 [Russula aff. rugulosa BPL654]|nr:hypothetical protein BGY98DRAFT_909570 [Russula aff. rugulosa BPL654]